MNGLRRDVGEFRKMMRGAAELAPAKCELVVCPPAYLLLRFREALGRARRISLGGQNCHDSASGAHTGDLSAEMLADAGADYVILGHSERRTDHGESDAAVLSRVNAAARAGLRAIVCIGETERERDDGRTLRVIGRQLRGSLPDGRLSKDTVIAYEPVWAIGTGRTPTAREVAAVHRFIRRKLVERYGEEGEGMRILYGGSVKPANSAELFSIDNVNGGLIGGASLAASDFLGIARSYYRD